MTADPGAQTSWDEGITKAPDASDTTSGVRWGYLKSETATPAIGPPFVSLRTPRIGGVAEGAEGTGADGAVGRAACRLQAKQPIAKSIATQVFVMLA
jgi:hypothetical protein